VPVQKWQILVQAKTAGLLKPQAQQRYVEHFNRARTLAWA
jgi:hypothetical protein